VPEGLEHWYSRRAGRTFFNNYTRLIAEIPQRLDHAGGQLNGVDLGKERADRQLSAAYKPTRVPLFHPENDATHDGDL
jgi:hypothetical protein